MDALARLLTPSNLRLFELLIDNPFSIRELAQKAGCSPAKVTQFAKLYANNNLIEKKRELNKKKIILVKSNPLVKEIVVLIFLHKILHSKSFHSLQSISQSIGVYGSAAEGTADKHSDIDMWVISKKRKGMVEAGTISRKMGEELEREVSIKFFTREDLNRLKEKDVIFYRELEYKSKILHGDGF